MDMGLLLLGELVDPLDFLAEQSALRTEPSYFLLELGLPEGVFIRSRVLVPQSSLEIGDDPSEVDNLSIVLAMFADCDFPCFLESLYLGVQHLDLVLEFGDLPAVIFLVVFELLDNHSIASVLLHGLSQPRLQILHIGVITELPTDNPQLTFC